MAEFFSRSVYRFLLPLIIISIALLLAAILFYCDSRGNIRDPKGFWVFMCLFAAYAAVTLWYAYRIARGTWREVWLNLITRIDANSLQTKQAPPPSISGTTAALSLLITGVVAILFARIFTHLRDALPHHQWWVFICVLPIFLGSGTLIAIFYDRSWRSGPKRVWMIAFNLLTCLLALFIGAALITFPISFTK